MKKPILFVVLALGINIAFAIISKTSIDYKSIYDLDKISIAGSDQVGAKIYSKDACCCYLNGDDSKIQNLCNATWTCISGTDFETCVDGAGCTTSCSCS